MSLNWNVNKGETVNESDCYAVCMAMMATGVPALMTDADLLKFLTRVNAMQFYNGKDFIKFAKVAKEMREKQLRTNVSKKTNTEISKHIFAVSERVTKDTLKSFNEDCATPE